MKKFNSKLQNKNENSLNQFPSHQRKRWDFFAQEIARNGERMKRKKHTFRSYEKLLEYTPSTSLNRKKLSNGAYMPETIFSTSVAQAARKTGKKTYSGRNFVQRQNKETSSYRQWLHSWRPPQEWYSWPHLWTRTTKTQSFIVDFILALPVVLFCFFLLLPSLESVDWLIWLGMLEHYKTDKLIDWFWHSLGFFFVFCFIVIIVYNYCLFELPFFYCISHFGLDSTITRSLSISTHQSLPKVKR